MLLSFTKDPASKSNDALHHAHSVVPATQRLTLSVMNNCHRSN